LTGRLLTTNDIFDFEWKNINMMKKKLSM
jgi:hypothetical protein